jgi:integrase
VSLFRFDRPSVVKIRDKAATRHGRRFGNYVHQVLRLLFSWALERGWMRGNPALGIKELRRPRNAPTVNRPWSDAERFVVLEEAPPHLLVPLALGMYAGLREGDALRLPLSAYDGTAIELRTSKTGQRVWLPAARPLREILDTALAARRRETDQESEPGRQRKQDRPQAMTLAVNSRGQPWTTSGFRASWRTFRLRLEAEGKVAPGLTFHGLRHTVATILREEGVDLRAIADLLGHATEGMARHYSGSADLRRTTIATVAKLDRAENRRRTSAVKPSVKPKGGSYLKW